MSVALHIRYKNTDIPEKAIWIGQQTFRDYWLPLFNELGLEWLDYVYNCGMPILTHLDVLPTLISELHILRDHFVTDEKTSNLAWLIEMTDKALILLEEVRANPDGFSDAYFG